MKKDWEDHMTMTIQQVGNISFWVGLGAATLIIILDLLWLRREIKPTVDIPIIYINFLLLGCTVIGIAVAIFLNKMPNWQKIRRQKKILRWLEKNHWKPVK